MIDAAGFGQHELTSVVDILVRVVEAFGAAIIFVGAVIAFVRFIHVSFRREGVAPFDSLRLDLGRFMVLGLEFQLAADILRTAVSPNFTALAQLAAIAAIRTALNFFLGREIKEERELVRADRAAGAPPPTGSPAASTAGPGAPDDRP
jgi:uncharacterized membrane protein